MKLKSHGYSILILILLSFSAQGQLYQRQYAIPVTMDGIPLYNPWAGGLNSCQISHIDANLDGKKDLFIFDKTNSKMSIYINMDDTPGTIDYKYTLEYNHVLPIGIRNWAFMRDMNCDGKEDLLVNSGGGFRIYWNNSETSLSFNLTPTLPVQALYEIENGQTITANIYSVAPDISAFDDFDNDGDIDAITWTENASALYLYVNMAVENGDCSVPYFVCKSMCYGMLNEAPDSFQIFTGEEFDCFINVVNPRSSEIDNERENSLHVGGTIAMIDLDQNGLKDPILGDVGNHNLVALPLTDASNGLDSAMYAAIDFPASFGSTIPVDLPFFPAAYYVDVNNDGVNDLVVSSNAFSDAEDRHGMWLYLNNGLNDLPDFEFVQDDFLQNQQIDLGSGAFPVVFDVDNDGKKDLLISNLKYYDGTNVLTNHILYFNNIGSQTTPAFELTNENWMDIPSHGWRGAYPAFGDLDNDGDADLIMGDQDGTLHYFLNDAPAGQPANFVLTETSLKDNNDLIIDVGQFSIPQLIDLNEDGLNDLIIGEYNGNINYYQNVGTPEQFEFQHVVDSLGHVAATSILGIQGKCVPHFFKNGQGLWELIMGTETGQINHYNNIEENFLGNFNLVTTTYDNIREGERTSVFLSDIDNDGLNDLFVGNLGGGIGIYKGLPVSIDEVKTHKSFKIYPNPAKDFIQIDLEDFLPSASIISIHDATGRVIKQIRTFSKICRIETNDISDGLYLISIQSQNRYRSERFVIQH